MREIKFKYYLETEYRDGKPEKKFSVVYTLQEIWNGTSTHRDLKIIARCEYTGREDKNGKEIYEGDKLKGWFTPMVVKYGEYAHERNDGQCTIHEKAFGWYGEDEDAMIIPLFYTVYGGWDYEIVGNVHE